jgi:hypothetical protein
MAAEHRQAAAAAATVINRYSGARWWARYRFSQHLVRSTGVAATRRITIAGAAATATAGTGADRATADNTATDRTAANRAASGSTTSTAATTSTGTSQHKGWRRGPFLIEHVERRQADVGDFFLAERKFVTRLDMPCRDVGRGSRLGRCAAASQ